MNVIDEKSCTVTARKIPAYWLLLAVLVLNLALGFHNIWPTPWIMTRYEIAVEAALIVLLIAGLVEARGSFSPRACAGLAVLMLLLIIGRYADVTAPALFGRPINLYWDSQHLPNVVAMLGRAAPWWQSALAVVALVSAMLLLLGLMRSIIRTISAGMLAARTRRVTIGLSGAIILVWAISVSAGYSPVSRWFSQPVSLSFGEQLHRLTQAMSEQTAQDFKREPLVQSDLAMIDKANVLVMFIESYGVTTLDNPAHRKTLAPARERLAAAVRRSGRQVASKLLVSPTFGGGSWLAHSSFLSGFLVRDQPTYERLLASSRPTWVKRFAQNGYRTVALVPGIRLAWPEGGYYGFDQLYDAARLAYPGPDFGWWKIPDQYSLAKAAALNRADQDTRPTMMFFTTITSHLPFQPVAPYSKDWEQMSGPVPYEDMATDKIRAGKTDWTNLGPAYLNSIDYALSTLAGYMDQQANKDTLIIVIGDHQPAASVTGPDASWAVPVHVLSHQPQILKRLEAIGFTAGIIPVLPDKPAKPTHPTANGFPIEPTKGSLHKLTNQLLTILDGHQQDSR